MSEKQNHKLEDIHEPKDGNGSFFTLRGLKERLKPITTKFSKHQMHEAVEASSEKLEEKETKVKKGKHDNREKRRKNLDKFKAERGKEKETVVSPESGAESSETAKGEQFIKNILDDMARDLSPEQAETLKQKESEFVEKVGKEKVLGKRLVSWFAKTTKAAKAAGAPIAGFAGGFAAKSALNYAAKTGARALLDYGTMGTSIAAGMVAGGSWAGVLAYRAESKRLKDIQTYAENLKGMEALSDLEKVEKYIAINEALKQNKVQDTTEEALEFKRQLSDLSVFVKEGAWKNLEGAEKFIKILGVRSSADTEDLNFENKKGLGVFDRAEAEAKKKQEKESIKQIQKEAKALLKKQGLTRNTGKIFLSTVKGAAIGAGTGFLGALAADAIFDKLGLGSKSISPEVSSAGSVVREVKKTIPTDYSVKMEKSIWDSVKQLYIDRGVDPSKISNRLINEGMKIASEANQVEITAHHGLDHAHFDAIKDVRMEKGFELHHLEKLNDLIKEAGGKPIEVEKTITITTNVPGTLPTPLPGSGGESWVNSRIEKIVDFGSKYKNTMLGVSMAGAGIAASYYALRKPKSRKEEKPGTEFRVQTSTPETKLNSQIQSEPIWESEITSSGHKKDSNGSLNNFSFESEEQFIPEPGWKKTLNFELPKIQKAFEEIEKELFQQDAPITADKWSMLSNRTLMLYSFVEELSKQITDPNEKVDFFRLTRGVSDQFIKIGKKLKEFNFETKKEVKKEKVEEIEVGWRKDLKDLMPGAISTISSIEDQLNKESKPLSDEKYSFYAEGLKLVMASIRVILDQAIESSEEADYHERAGELNELFLRVSKKLRESKSGNFEAAVASAEAELDDSSDSGDDESGTAKDSSEVKTSTWEEKFKKIEPIINEELPKIREFYQNTFETDFNNFDGVKHNLDHLLEVRKALGTVEKIAIGEKQAEEFDKKVESLRAEVNLMIRRLENLQKPQNGRPKVGDEEKKKSVDNSEKLTDEQELLLAEALDLGLITQEQVDNWEFKKRLNKYELIFAEGGLVDKHFGDESLEIKKRLKIALSECNTQNNNDKLIRIFTDYWDEASKSPVLSNIFDVLSSSFGSLAKKAYKKVKAQMKVK